MKKLRLWCSGLLIASVGLWLMGCANIATYPPQHSPMPAGTSGSNQCGEYSGYLLFSNGGAGFVPASGQTMGVAYIQLGDTTQPRQPQENFNLLWRVSGTVFGCATNAADSTKSFPCSSPNKYFVTVYFTPGHCPPKGTVVWLTLNFQ